METIDEWRDWLDEHHTSEPEIWLVYYKKATGIASIARSDALDEALCFGWIDSLVKRLDDQRYAIKFTPRKADSRWSDVNRKRYAVLKASGRLEPPGTGSSSSTPASWTAPVTRSTRDAGRADGPQSRDEAQRWLQAYEDKNVDTGLACGLVGRAQIGKGMWAMPDRMADMLEQKIGHPAAGASTAWVPSPTAATLHAIHYHRVDVAARQRELPRSRRATIATCSDPGRESREWTDENARSSTTTSRASSATSCAGSIRASVAPRCQTSTTSALMEDRATAASPAACRQLAAAWHRDPDEVEAAFRRMAAVVDGQNASDPRIAAWLRPATASPSTPLGRLSSKASTSHPDTQSLCSTATGWRSRAKPRRRGHRSGPAAPASLGACRSARATSSWRAGSASSRRWR